MENRELNFQLLIQKIGENWVKILISAIVLGVAFAAYSAFPTALKILKINTNSAAKAQFEQEIENWEQKKAFYQSNAEIQARVLAEEKEYVSTSGLLKLDAMNYALEKVVISAESEEIFLWLATQVQYGNWLNEVGLKAMPSQDQRYISQLIGTEIDRGAGRIVFEAKSNSQSDAKAAFVVFRDWLYQMCDAEGIAISSLSFSESLSVISDADLLDLQTRYASLLNDLKLLSNEATNEYKSYVASGSPKVNYSVSGLLKKTIKGGVIGVAVGLILSAVVIAFYFIFVPCMWDPSWLDEKNIAVLCTVRSQKAQKKNLFKKQSFVVDSAMGRISLSRVMKENQIDKVALIGDVSAEQLAYFVSDCTKAEQLSMIPAGNIFASEEAAKKADEIDEVVMLIKENVTRLDSIERQAKMAEIWGKKLLGVVIIK